LGSIIYDSALKQLTFSSKFSLFTFRFDLYFSVLCHKTSTVFRTSFCPCGCCGGSWKAS